MPYVLFASDGLSGGAYVPGINCDAPPDGSVQITDEAWSDWLANAGLRQWDGAAIVTIAPPAVVPAVPEIISDRQFFQQLAVDGTITEDEALAYVSVGTLPARLANAIDTLPAAARFSARMQVIGAKQFLRSNPLTATIGQILGMDATALDRIWTLAAAL